MGALLALVLQAPAQIRAQILVLVPVPAQILVQTQARIPVLVLAVEVPLRVPLEMNYFQNVGVLAVTISEKMQVKPINQTDSYLVTEVVRYVDLDV